MQINQVLWIINNDSQSVIPVRIVEKVTKETISGVKTEFIVETVSGKKTSLSSINGPHFEDIQDASNHLLNSATELINRVIAKATESARKFQNVSHSVQKHVQFDDDDDKMYQEEPETVTMPDGRQVKVRIKLPED